MSPRSLFLPFPNVLVGIMCVVATVVEAVLLLQVPHHVYASGGPLPWLTVLGITWFWLTSGWLVWGLARGCERVRSRFGKLTGGVAYSGVALALTGALLLHISSWGLYLKTGRFANWEGFLFLAVNPPHTIWLDLTVSERTTLTALGLSGLLGLIVLPWSLRRGLGMQPLATTPESLTAQLPSVPRLTPLMCWNAVTLALTIPGLVLAHDESGHRKMSRVDVLKNSLCPPLTLAMSGGEMLLTETIRPCLDPAQLEPFSAGAAWCPGVLEPGKTPFNVVILSVESLRADTVHLVHQGREVMPHLNRLARAGVHFTNAYAQSTHSDYADVCIVSSLFPLRTRGHHYYQRSDPWTKALAFDVFKRAGHQTAIISSQNECWGGMDQFLETPNLDLFYDAQRSGQRTHLSSRDPGFAHELGIGSLSAGRLEDAHTMDKAIEWVASCASRNTPFCLSMNFQSSHFPYEIPDDAPRPFQPCHLDEDVTFMDHPPSKTPLVKNAYYNGIHQCDVQIGRMADTLNRLGKLDNTVLVVLGENGEAFHESQSVGHAREPVEPVIHVATVIHAPALLEARVETYPLQHVDLLPTIHGLLGWSAHPSYQGIDVLAADRPALEDRLLFFHVNSPAAHVDALQSAGRWKFSLNLRTGATMLHDLQSDPGESQDVSRTHPQLASRLHATLAHWRERQLAYYHFHAYYQVGYAPDPPGLSNATVVR